MKPVNVVSMVGESGVVRGDLVLDQEGLVIGCAISVKGHEKDGVTRTIFVTPSDLAGLRRAVDQMMQVIPRMNSGALKVAVAAGPPPQEAKARRGRR